MGMGQSVRSWRARWLLVLGLIAVPVMAPERSGWAAAPEDDEPAVQGPPVSPGRLLREALEARDRGETARAEAGFTALAENHPIIADYADLLRFEILIAAQRYRDVIDGAKTWKHQDSPVHSDFLTLLGRAYAEFGKPEDARASWGASIADTDDSERLAALHLSVADSYANSGDMAAAAESYLRVWTAYALTPEADAADKALNALERRIRTPLREPAHWRKRADTLYRWRRNEEALAAYEQALNAKGEPLTASERRRANGQRARTLFRLRRYSQATKAFAALPADDEIAIWTARSLARAGEVEEAAQRLEAIGQGTRGNNGLRATLLAGLLWEGEGQSERARALYSAVANRAPSSSYGRAALWKLGWQAYRAGHYEEAIAYFERQGKSEDDAVAALRSRYWQARAAERAGKKESAEAFANIASEYPLSYYGWRSRARVGNAAPTFDGEEGDPLERIGITEGRNRLAPRELERPRILLEAGLAAEAREELDRLFTRARGRQDRLSLAQLYADAGDFHKPQRLMVDAYAESLARGPAPGQLELWWHAWPAAFEQEVKAHADEPVAPELVFAVMREESGYRPEVVSVSGARGLLQLMPSTAERVARRSGMSKPTADDLFAPDVNIQLGALYLGELSGRFPGRTSAVIGSYNAGPEAVARWLRQSPVEDDEWVEEIGYEQTRSYVKRVLRSLHAYQVLY
jgi:soluble lytic murein transglycosylase